MRHFIFISMLFFSVCAPSFGSCALSIIFEKMHNVSTLPNDFEEVMRVKRKKMIEIKGSAGS
jgi:hypothetical protein